MPPDLQAKLPELLPKVNAWVQTLIARIEREGTPISEELQALARRLGVRQAEAIRLLEVEHLPPPEDPELCRICFASGMLGANMTGLTLGYHILVVRGCAHPRFLAHDFRHVYQFEEAGSLENFLSIYASQVLACGHNDAPLEWDARQQEKLATS